MTRNNQDQGLGKSVGRLARRLHTSPQRKWLWALFLLAPIELGAKGCDSVIVGDDCPAGSSAECAGGTAGSAGNDADCGGLLGLACSAGEYCNYAEDAACGAADQTGTCTELPSACEEIYAPVCGCDDKTYGNACEAATQGISVASSGACKEPGGVKACGGLLGLACATDEYCDFPRDAFCGAADQTGTCRVQPMACDAVYLPVCGCDDQTYGNACEAAIAGVSVAADGQCRPSQPVETACGGLLGRQCAVGEYCKYDLDALCGAADQTGICASSPSICDDISNPVCGCDGETYANECEAAAAGSGVSSVGACAGTERACGGLLGLQCERSEYCNFTPEAFCGAADQTGTCSTRPTGCTKNYQPVCGCDDVTYGNDCEAAAAGVSVSASGPCAD